MMDIYEEFNDRINKFYQYLEQRLEIQDEMEKQEYFENISKSEKILHKSKRQSVTSII